MDTLAFLRPLAIGVFIGAAAFALISQKEQPPPAPATAPSAASPQSPAVRHAATPSPATPNAAAQSAGTDSPATAKPLPLSITGTRLYSDDGAFIFRLTLNVPYDATLRDAPGKTKTNFSDYITSTPAADITFENGFNGLHIHGNFKPQTEYTITVAKGLGFKPSARRTAAKEYVLENERRFTFRTPDLTPRLAFNATGRYLAPSGDSLVLPLKAVNIPRLKATVCKIPVHNIAQLLARETKKYAGISRDDDADTADTAGTADHATASELALEPKTRTYSFAPQRNTPQTPQLNLLDFTAPGETGVFLVELSALQKDKEERLAYKFLDFYRDSDQTLRPVHRLVCVSDIGLTAHRFHGKLLVWATSLKTGSPLRDVTVKLWRANNTVAAEGKTDANGLLTLNAAALGADPTHLPPFLLNAALAIDTTHLPFLLTAALADDTTFLPLEPNHALASAVTDDLPAGTRAYLTAGQHEAFVFSDRGIYRHGEPLFVQAIVRDSEGRAPKPLPLRLEVRKPNGQLFKTLPLLTDAAGAAVPTEPLAIPDEQPSGNWTFVVCLPDGSKLGVRTVAIEDFVPPQIRVALKDVPEKIGADGKFGFAVASEFLFGRPAVGLEVRGTASYENAPFAPDAWKQYTFGDSRRGQLNVHARTAAQKLDAAGTARLVVAPLKALGVVAAAVCVTAEGTVFEPGGRAISTRTAPKVFHVVPHYLGLRTQEPLLLAGKPATIQVAAVAPDGARLAAKTSAKVTIARLSEIWNYTHNGNSYEFRAETIRSEIKTETLQIPADADAHYTFTPPTEGRYEVAVEAQDSAAATSHVFFAGGDYDRARALKAVADSGDKLALAFDKESYAVGETARATVGVPHDGTALVTIRNAKLARAFTHVITPKNNSFDIPLDADAAPGVEVSVTLTRPAVAVAEGEWGAHRFYGRKTLQVRRPGDTLNVQPQTTVKIRDGGTTVDVRVQVAPAAKDDPVFVTVTLSDEALHILSHEKLPDPAGFFAAPRLFGSRIYDMFSRLIPIVKADNVLRTDSASGGDYSDRSGGLLQRISPVKSRRFQPLSRWHARVPVKDGVAQTTFELPEFSGEVRVTAVAWSSTATGSAKEQAAVRPKLVAQADGPRFLAPGDEAEVVLSVYNESGAETTAEVSAVFENASGVFKKQQLDLLKDGTAKLVCRLKASAVSGHSVVRFRVAGAGETHEHTLEFPVRPAAAWETLNELKILAPGARETFRPPAGFLAGLTSQSFRTRADVGIELLPALRYLTHYPYGCVEQTTSAVFPLIAANGEGSALLADDPNFAATAKENVNAAVRRLQLMWLGERRGFAFWPSSRSPSDTHYALYAAHFVIEAAKGGATVGDTFRKEIEGWLNRIANDTHSTVRQRAYACHILAISGHPERNAMLAVKDATDTAASSTPYYHLARAFALTGDLPRAQAILATAKAMPTTPTSPEELCFAILAQMEIAPDSPDIGTWIERLRTLRGKHEGRREDSHWGTTWDNAHALLAFAAYARKSGVNANADAVLNFTLADAARDGGKPVAVSGGRAHRYDAGGGAAVTFANNSDTPLYILRAARGISAQVSAAAVSHGLQLTREFYDEAGKKLEAGAAFRAGDQVVVRLALRPLGSGGVALGDEALSDVAIKQVAVEDLLPACFEAEPGAFLRAGDLGWVPPHSAAWAVHREIRDDRVLVFSGEEPLRVNADSEIWYRVRVVGRGRFVLPAARAEAMYDPAIHARTPSGTTIEAKQ
ncbi:MAG: hypothetical protein LBT53_02695 [Puniceicoccales bacterium]|jgi:uncharacterized protein YfaS (alpha-2-macroglobulin family)|nr:hypothetical protein [Puniceicoccales bacterium]